MRKTTVVFIALFYSLLVAGPTFLSAETTTRTCKDGSQSHPATADEANSAGSGIVAGVTQLCPEDAALGISNSVGQAKDYLLSIAKGLPGTKAPPDKAHIDALNNSFAVCAAGFLKAYSQKYGVVTISSAFRCGPQSPATIQCNRSENANAGGATGSNHQSGLAMDVNPANGNYQQLWSFAQANPQFGVCFPYLSSDRPHMALAGANTGEAAKCASQGITKPCSGSNFDPNQIKNPGPSTLQKTSNLMQNLNSLLSPPKPQQCPAGYTLMNGTCLPQQALTSQQTTNPYSYLSSTPASSVTPSTSVNPSTGGTGSVSGTSNTNTNTNPSNGIGTLGSNVLSGTTGGNVSGNLNGGSQNGSSSSISAIDLINQIANPTTTDNGWGDTQPQATGTPVQLGSHLNDTVTLHGTPVSLNGTVQASDTYQLSSAVSQTFVSQDLSKTPVNSYTPQQPVNSTFAILEDLKQKLLYVIGFLKPFGGVTPGTVTSTNSTTAYME